MRGPDIRVSGKRIVLLAVAGMLSVSGAIAIGILLFGQFQQTEGRILGTTALLAAYGLLAVPAAMLLDRGRLPVLALLVLTLALAGASLAVSALWTSSASDAHGKAVGTATALLIASAQVSALVLRQPERDRILVRRLFVLSSVLGGIVATMFTLLLWAEIDSERYGRVLGALVVLDLLAVVLQPTMARAQPRADVFRLQVALESDAIRDVEVLAPDLAAAAAKAIRQIEREGHRVLRLQLADTRGRRSDD